MSFEVSTGNGISVQEELIDGKSKMKLTFDEVASIMEDLREIVFKCCRPHSH